MDKSAQVEISFSDDEHMFYCNLGRAFAAWQKIEVGLFLLFQAAIDLSFEMTSLVFFHIKSQDSKAQLVDKAWQEGLAAEKKEEWKKFYRDIDDAVRTRNHLAHYEPMATSRVMTELEVDSYHFMLAQRMDHFANSRETCQVYTTSQLCTLVEKWVGLSRDLTKLAITRRTPTESDIKSLPPEVLLLIRSIQADLQSV